MADTRIAFRQFTALVAHKIDEAVALAKVDPGLLWLRSGLDETPLHYLVVENQTSAVARLIGAGASVNVVNFCGSSPLLEASGLGYVDMCQLLLEHGADPAVKNNTDETALSTAALRNHEDIFELLLAHCARNINDYFSDLEVDELQTRPADPIQQRCRNLGLRAGFEREDFID